jgi:hypothetical protein
VCYQVRLTILIVQLVLVDSLSFIQFSKMMV